MPFSLPQRPTRDVIGLVTIEIKDPDGQNVNRTVAGKVKVFSSSGELAGTWEGDLVPHMGDAPVTLAQLASLLNWARTKAEQELLEVA